MKDKLKINEQGALQTDKLSAYTSQATQQGKRKEASTMKKVDSSITNEELNKKIDDCATKKDLEQVFWTLEKRLTEESAERKVQIMQLALSVQKEVQKSRKEFQEGIGQLRDRIDESRKESQDRAEQLRDRIDESRKEFQGSIGQLQDRVGKLENRMEAIKSELMRFMLIALGVLGGILSLVIILTR